MAIDPGQSFQLNSRMWAQGTIFKSSRGYKTFGKCCLR